MRRRALEGRLEIVRWLVDTALGSTVRTGTSAAPLFHAALRDRTEVVAFPIERGADPNARRPHRDADLLRGDPPELVRRMVRDGDPHLIVTLANDAWFGDSQEPWMHLALARLRAVEHGRFLVRSTNSGVSALVDPAGRVVAGAFALRPRRRDVWPRP